MPDAKKPTISHENWNVTIDVFIQRWRQLEHIITDIKKGHYTKEDITYTLPFLNIMDLSLVSNEGIFKHKPPIFWKQMWNANSQALINMMTEITDWQQAKAKLPEGVTEAEMIHVLCLERIIDWCTKKRFPQYTIERKTLLRGDFRPKSKWTI